MRVRVSDLSHDGLKISDTIPLEPLNARMQEGRPTEIYFTEAPTVELFVEQTATGAEVSGHVLVKYMQNCARCLESLEQQNTIPIQYAFRYTTRESAEAVDDIGIVALTGEHIELEDLIQEQIILSLSYHWSPELDEENKCSLCHKNFASTLQTTGGTSLGALLEQAGVKK